MQKELFNIDEVCAMLNCGRTYLYEQLNSGLLKGVRLGKKTLITKAAIQDYVVHLKPYQEVDING